MSIKGISTAYVTYSSNTILPSYKWINVGDGALFDEHLSYTSYTDADKSTTGIAFNAGDDRPLIKYLPTLKDLWVSFDYYNAEQWRWVQVFLNDNRSIGLRGTDDATFFRFYNDEYEGQKGLNHLVLHFDARTNQAEIWINGDKKKTVSDAGLSGQTITRIAFSPSGWSSNYASYTSNAMSNITLEQREEKIDFSLPEGAAGRTNNYVLYSPHVGMTVRKLDVFFTYKQDDKINLWEGSDTFIKGYTSSFATYRPHDGVSVKGLEVWLTYRKHDGVDIRKIEPFLLYKQEDKVDSFTVPHGISGRTSAYIIYRKALLRGFIDDFPVNSLQSIALHNVRIGLKDISCIHNMPIEHNTTNIKEV